jgi:hypothetical protein
MTEDKTLSLPAAQLARAAPREWEQFKAAFRLFADLRRDELVAAGADELKRSQGRAQICVQINSLLEDCVKVADRRKP